MKKILSLLAAIALVLTLSACSEKETTKDPDKTELTHSQGVSENSIKVGNSMAVSGALATIGLPMQLGMEAYFEMVNENGGINGRKIEYVHKDDEFKPELGIAILEELIYDEEVFGIVGHFGSPIIGATLDTIKDEGIPTVYLASGIASLYNEEAASGTGDNIFPVQPIYVMEGRILTAMATSEFEAKKIGVIYTSDDVGKDGLRGIEIEAKKLGIEVISEALAVGSADATAQVQKIKDCDVVIAPMLGTSVGTVLKEMEKQGVMLPVLLNYNCADPTIEDLNSPAIPNLLSKAGVYASGWLDLSADFTEFFTYMAKVSDDPSQANAFAMSGWMAASFFCEGIKRLGDGEITWEAYIDAMEKTPVNNPFGGAIDYKDGARLGTQAMNLSKMDPTTDFGWTEVVKLSTIEELIN